MTQAIEVLLVEDDPEDVELTREMLKTSALSLNLAVVQDGVEAMAYLREKAAHSNAVRPDFILLDLNMPRKGGREVLQEIKSDPKLKGIPVIIFTTSSNERDMRQCQSLGADCFLTKPVGLKQFKWTVKKLEDFWLKNAKAPNL